MILGAVGAIGQTNIKRLLAYSSIANIGFALVGLAAASPTGHRGAAVLHRRLSGDDAGHLPRRPATAPRRWRTGRSDRDLAGLSKTRPALAAALTIFMFSLAGIPPLLGFWPKFAVFQAAVAAGLSRSRIIGFVTSVVAAYYYLRLVKVMFFDEPGVPATSDGSVTNGAMIAAAALFCSPLGMLAITPMVAATGRAAASLFTVAG